MFMDIIFSLDSIITAIGLANRVEIIIIAIVVAVIFMMIFSSPLNRFVDNHPTIKIVALSFLLLIGKGFDMHIHKGYIYFAMTFSAFC